MYKYFSDTDFRNADPSCSIEDMNPVFLYQLDVARYLSGVPYIILSAHRTEEHEHKKGRDGTSSHCKGIAVDLKATNSRTRFKIIQGLLQAGFTRIGFGENFIHVDSDPDKDQDVTWHYYPKKETGNSFGI